MERGCEVSISYGKWPQFIITRCEIYYDTRHDTFLEGVHSYGLEKSKGQNDLKICMLDYFLVFDYIYEIDQRRLVLIR